MRETWQHRAQRAEQLAAAGGASAPLLVFYAALLRAQGDLAACLQSGTPLSGRLEADLSVLRPHLAPLLRAVAASASDILANDAHRLLDDRTGRLEAMLRGYWRAPSDRDFFAKAIVQPYAQRLAETGAAPLGREVPPTFSHCPFCKGTPQLSLFRGAGDAALEGAGRSLQCATCLTTWPFRRVLCPNCGEEDERKLGYFQSPEFDHVRVEACDSCHHYVKGIDLTRVGLAVPLVDEVASASLDAWASEHGYKKVELNLVGL